MVQLCVDIGNTRVKWGLAPANAPVGPDGVHWALTGAGTVAPTPEPLGVPPGSLHRLVYCSVRDKVATAALVEAMAEAWASRPMEVGPQLVAGLMATAYQDPQQLGADRWAALLAARHRLAGRPGCVVDAGTAVTIDWLSAEGRHQGGVILPGRMAMYRALGQGTGRLGPDVPDPAMDALPTGGPAQGTRDGIRLGVGAAVAGGIERALTRYAPTAGPAAKRDSLHLLLTGGDAGWIRAAAAIPALYGAECVPELVLEGLVQAVR